VCVRASDVLHTGANFLERSAAKHVRFIRVTYVRQIVHRGHEHHLHVDGHPAPAPPPPPRPDHVSGARTATPLPGFAYRTFTPAPVKVAMCSGQPEYESLRSMWQRSRAWINAVGKSSTSRPAVTAVVDFVVNDRRLRDKILCWINFALKTQHVYST